MIDGTSYDDAAHGVSQREKGERFAALHAREGAFIIPNPWDAGSARLLTVLGGFEAMATTSGGAASTFGRADGAMTRDQSLANARAIVEATHLPVSADLESGYGETPEQVAETIRLAGTWAGLVGGSIEDATGDRSAPLYSLEHATERVAAAAEAARALPFRFMLVARAENFLVGERDLDEVIRRLQAYEAAGADVLFAPGLISADEIRTVCQSVTKPVNVLGGLAAPGETPLTVAELAALGVRRVSVGSALSRVALTAFVQAATELQRSGTFGFVRDAMPYARVQQLMSEA